MSTCQSTPHKIPYQELVSMLGDLDLPDEELAQYLVFDTEESGSLSISLAANPELVEMSEDQEAMESAMGLLNGLAKARRVGRAKRQLRWELDKPLIVSEGDSWFQFPLLLRDVIDHLGKDFITWGVGSAGDSARTMARQRQYLKPLRQHPNKVKAFLFSGAGNDIIGEQSSGEPALTRLVLGGVGSNSAEDYINQSAVSDAFNGLTDYYENVLRQVRAVEGLGNLPILLHGYDYVFPGSPDDARDPIYAAPDEWLGSVFAQKGVPATKPALRRQIIRLLIDRLYDMLNQLAARDPDVHVVDVRGALPNISDWRDEIHPTSKAFGKVADRFRSVLADVI